MSLSDPIGDMIARIKNAQVRNHKKVALPSSNFKVKIADILKSEGFIKDYKVETELKKPVLSVDLKACNNYKNGLSAVKKIKCPTFFIFGESDKMIKLEKGKKFSSLVPGSNMHVIKDCGHMIMLEKPFEMREKIIEFLKK